MSTKNTKHLFPIINLMIDKAVADVEAGGETITCHRGCDHCCHLLVETSWHEAEAMADWVMALPAARKKDYVRRVKNSANEVRDVLSEKKSGRKYLEPYDGESELPDWAYDNYFYDKKRPCAFLQNGECTAYEVRPTSCRLHMVSSDPALCRHDVEDDADYEVPDQIEELKDDSAAVISAIETDDRWGPLPLLIEGILAERGLCEVPSIEDVLAERKLKKKLEKAEKKTAKVKDKIAKKKQKKDQKASKQPSNQEDLKDSRNSRRKRARKAA